MQLLTRLLRGLYSEMISFFKKNQDTKRIKDLESEVLSLKNELNDLKLVVKQMHDTICVVTAAQYQIGNDVGMIYTTLKSITSAASSMDDDIFSFGKDDDDKGYLN